jgi:uncharacterized repeat protein (TIGR01451 family)
MQTAQYPAHARRTRTLWIAAALAACTSFEISAFAVSGDLQGLNRTDATNWSATSAWSGNNLRGWQELDLIPCRVVLNGPADNSPVTIQFPRTRHGVPGFEDLFFISNSPNVTLAGPPVLSAPADSEEWSYRLNVTIADSDGEPACIYFYARLAAGSDRNPGSSLHLRGEPSLSPLQIHKPGPAARKPDLGVSLAGPEGALPGETLVYGISYTNSATGSNDIAHNSVLTAMLPPFAEYVPGSASAGGSLNGNVLSWNLGDLGPGDAGSVSYQVIVSPDVAPGFVLTNIASIDADENDLVLADNSSTFTTAVAANTSPSPGGAVRITRITRFDDEIFHIYFETHAGRSYAIQYTKDFIEWTTDPAVIPGKGIEVVSRQRNAGEKRFYRVMELP